MSPFQSGDLGTLPPLLTPEEAAKKELWLQLVEARQKVGLTQAEMAQRLGVSQAQVARIEKRGYDAYTLNTLRRYVAALGGGFVLEVRVSPAIPLQKKEPAKESAARWAASASP